MNSNLVNKIKNIKIVLTDVDGTLTDGGMYYSSKGDTMKKFYVRDGMAVNILRRNNIFTPDHKFYNGTEIKMEELIPIECQGGDLIIFDTNCIHAGGDSFEEGKYRKVIRLHISKK